MKFMATGHLDLGLFDRRSFESNATYLSGVARY